MRWWIVAGIAGCGGSQAPVEEAAPRGEASLSTEAMRQDVELLSADTFKGRDTAGEGEPLARAVIVERFTSLGLLPVPGQDGFEVPYTLYRIGYDPDHTGVQWADGAARPGVDMRPFDFSDAGEVTAPVVFAGYGITAPDLKWDDYAGLDVEGKLVLVLRHAPEEGVEDSPWSASGEYALFATKAKNAEKHGAVGMILVTDPANHEGPEDLRSGRVTPELDAPEQGAPQDAPTAPFLAVHVARSVAQALLGDRDLLALQQALDGGEAVNGPLETEVTVSVQEREPVPADTRNVIGWLEGSDPVLKDEWVVIGGHYDHVGAFAGEGGDTVFNGADDNASGTAGVLALAAAFASLEPAPARSVVFAAFSGEEKGLLGSRAAVADEVLPAENIVFMLNLDMIGRPDSGKVSAIGDGFGSGIGDALTAANGDLGLPLELGGDRYQGNSDHHPFRQVERPFLHLFTGVHDDYHQLGDHADKLDYSQMASIVRLSYRLTDLIASGALTPRFVHHVGWLGVRIDLEDGEGGALVARITEVDPTLRGGAAGLEVGDVVRAVGDETLEEAEAVGRALDAVEPGQLTTLNVQRGERSEVVEVERAKPGYLGVFPANPAEGFRQEHGLADDQGFALRSVEPETPAAEAGLRADDVVIAIEGVPVGLATLRRHLSRIGAGEPVEVEIIRDGERMNLPLTLGERPTREQMRRRTRRRP